MTSSRRVVHYINILTDPGTHEHTVCSRIGVGRDDGVWFTARLEEQGIGNNFDVRVVKAADGEQLPTVQDGEVRKQWRSTMRSSVWCLQRDGA